MRMSGFYFQVIIRMDTPNDFFIRVNTQLTQLITDGYNRTKFCAIVSQVRCLPVWTAQFGRLDSVNALLNAARTHMKSSILGRRSPEKRIVFLGAKW